MDTAAPVTYGDSSRLVVVPREVFKDAIKYARDNAYRPSTNSTGTNIKET